MKSYLRYSDWLDGLLDEIEWGNRVHPSRLKVLDCLNGGASHALREIVSDKKIRKYGTFFTDEILGRRVVSPLAKRKQLREMPVCDPTCGVGDLLLRWAEFLPIKPTLEGTLQTWEKLLFGTDLHPEFLEVARRRLVLLALVRGARLKRSSPPEISTLFAGLTTANVLEDGPKVPAGTTVLMNPPFTYTKSPDDCEWASGKVSLAAVSFLKCLDQCRQGQYIAAILPDVLRSGTRYSRWRNNVEERFQIGRLDIYGRFDSHVDVDVFILEGQVGVGGKATFGWTTTSDKTRRQKMKSICTISVGAVVPHRDPKKGQWKPYVEVADLPAWTKVLRINSHRRFKGSTVKPPFVAVRRTSSPSDSERAIGTIVSTQKSVALENHVIALQPKDEKVETCKLIMKSLKDSRTRAWLNRRIRCRHLTVSAMNDLPLWRDEG